MESLKFHRILLKLSGEALSGDNGNGIDPNRARDIALRVKEVREMGVDVAIVIGAGNLWRGVRDGRPPRPPRPPPGHYLSGGRPPRTLYFPPHRNLRGPNLWTGHFSVSRPADLHGCCWPCWPSPLPPAVCGAA